MSETKWLIERGDSEGHAPTIWWTGRKERTGVPYQDRWTISTSDAQRFNTKEAAFIVARRDVYQLFTITEHIFC